MKKAYICSPYRANSKKELDRNIEYARSLTKKALMDGFAPITPHLYLTQCLDEWNLFERNLGLIAGLDLIGICDVLYLGTAYGLSEGMNGEVKRALALGIEIVKC